MVESDAECFFAVALATPDAVPRDQMIIRPTIVVTFRIFPFH